MISQLTVSISFAENKEWERICNPVIKMFHFLHQQGKQPLCWPPRRSLQRKRGEGERSSQQDRCLAITPMGVEDLQLTPFKLPATYPLRSLCTPPGTCALQFEHCCSNRPLITEENCIQVSPGRAGPWGFLAPQVNPSGTCCHTHNQLGTGAPKCLIEYGGCIWASFRPGPAFSSQFPAQRRDGIANERRRAVWRERSTPPPQPLLPRVHKEVCGTHQPGAAQALFARRPGAKCPTGSPRKPQRRPHFPEAALHKLLFVPNPH